MTDGTQTAGDGSIDLVIRGAKVVTEAAEVLADVAVRGEKIAGLLAPGFPLHAKRTINADGYVLIPGGIDPHTHISWRWDDQVSQDSFDSASKVALESGTTTVIDFLPIPRQSDPMSSVATRMTEVADHSMCDYSFHPILTSATPPVLQAIADFVAMGLASFKMYTTYPESRVDDGDIWRLMQAIHAARGLAGFHAESDDIVGAATRALLATDRQGVRHYPESRPALSETIAIGTISRFAKELGSSVYIYHVASGLGAVREARARGVQMMAETCTHYLTLSRCLYEGPEAWRYVMSPPLPDEPTRHELWRALANREIQSVASDHCAYSREQKRYTQDTFQIPGGVPGIGARIPLLLSEGVNSGRLSLKDFVYVSSAGIARALGLFPRKGTIAVGSDADLVLVDLEAPWSMSDGNSSADFSPYAGMNGRGLPVTTIRRGEVVWDGRSFKGVPGSGVFVPQRPGELEPRTVGGADDAEEERLLQDAPAGALYNGVSVPQGVAVREAAE
jgi:dihydropyrimidinase